MAYPPHLLNDGETISVDLHPHWLHFTEPVLVLVGSIVLGIISLRFDAGSTMRDVLGWIALVAIAGSALWTLGRYISWATSHFVVTNHRIIYRSGWINKGGIDIPLDRVNNVIINRNLLERMAGAGDLLIESAGETGQQRFSDIMAPEKVQNQIFAEIQGVKQPPVTPVVTDVAGQLERLEGMMRRGTLTPEEFEAQKRRLLGS